jgi:hypothetical protein
MRTKVIPPGLIAVGIALALGSCAASWYIIAHAATPVTASVSPPAISPQRSDGALPQSTGPKTFIPYRDASPVIEALRQNLPAELLGTSSAELEVAWSGWVLQRDKTIRARLERGDEDSIVHFWQYGTSFTKQPPLTERNLLPLGGADAAARILEQRLDDVVTGMASPRANERLQFARRVLEQHGIDPTTSAGVAQARAYLEALRRRVLAEYDEQRRTLESAQHLEPTAALAAFGTMFRDRGLSSDTSLLPSFAIEQALESRKAQGLAVPGSVRRVAIVGPGLDFANKDDGYDFYPQQTIQPFGLMDSLLRLGLATEAELVVTTFDLSPRVNQHLEAIVKRARTGGDHVVYVPLQGDEQWSSGVVDYWRRFGDRIGKEIEAGAAPPSAGAVRIRAVRIPSARVASIVPRDLNMVLERLDPLAADQRFDLIVATNILVYYDVFEQELALANIANMLRPGGLFLTNTPVPPLSPMKLSDRYTTVSYSDRQTDHLFWYERQ